MNSQYQFDKHNWMVGDSSIVMQPTGKFPLVAYHQWNTLDDLMEFVHDINSTAIPGMVVTVVNDTDDKKGVYHIDSIGENGKVSKLLDYSVFEEFSKEVEDSKKYDMSKIGDDWLTEKIGGVEGGLKKDDEYFNDITRNDIIDDLLFPTILPEIKEPSVSLKFTEDYNYLILVNDLLPTKSQLVYDYDRGSITYPYREKLPYAGNATEDLRLDGFDYAVNFTGDDTLKADTDKIYNVIYSVMFEDGEPVLDNKGNESDIPTYNKNTVKTKVEIHAVYPVFTNSPTNIVSKHVVKADYLVEKCVFEVSIPEETSNKKFELIIPNDTEIVSVKQYNSISDSYNIPIEMVTIEENIRMRDYDELYNHYARTNINSDIQGETKYQIEIRKTH